MGYSGKVHCFDTASGDVIWNFDLVQDHGALPVQFGFAASPLVVTNQQETLVVFQAAGPQQGLIAVRLDDGIKDWSSEPAAFSYSSPLLINVADQRQLLFAADNRVLGLSPETGTTLWSHPLPEPGLTNMPTPLVLGDGLFAISGQGVRGTQLLKMTARPLTEGIQEPAMNIEVLWTSRITIEHGNWIQSGGQIHGGGGFLYALDATSGNRNWVKRDFENANTTVLADGSLAVQTQDGRLRHLRATPKGLETLAEIQLFDGDAWTPPTVVSNRLYARNRKEIVALDLAPR